MSDLSSMNITKLKQYIKDMGLKIPGLRNYKAQDVSELRKEIKKHLKQKSPRKSPKKSPRKSIDIELTSKNLRNLKITALKNIAKDVGVKGYSKFRSGDIDELIKLILAQKRALSPKVARDGSMREIAKSIRESIREEQLYSASELKQLKITALKKIAKEVGVKGYSKFKSGDVDELVKLILKTQKSSKKSPLRKSPLRKSPIVQEVDVYTASKLKHLKITELKRIAKEVGVKGYSKFRSGDIDELIDLILKAQKMNKVSLEVAKSVDKRTIKRYTYDNLKKLKITELKRIAKEVGVKGYSKFKSGDIDELVDLILTIQNEYEGKEEVIEEAEDAIIDLDKVSEDTLPMIVNKVEEFKEKVAKVIDNNLNKELSAEEAKVQLDISLGKLKNNVQNSISRSLKNNLREESIKEVVKESIDEVASEKPQDIVEELNRDLQETRVVKRNIANKTNKEIAIESTEEVIEQVAQDIIEKASDNIAISVVNKVPVPIAKDIPKDIAVQYQLEQKDMIKTVVANKVVKKAAKKIVERADLVSNIVNKSNVQKIVKNAEKVVEKINDVIDVKAGKDYEEVKVKEYPAVKYTSKKVKEIVEKGKEIFPEEEEYIERVIRSIKEMTGEANVNVNASQLNEFKNTIKRCFASM